MKEFNKTVLGMINKEKECLELGYTNAVEMPPETIFSLLSDLEGHFFRGMEQGENTQDDFFEVCQCAAKVRVLLGFPSDLYSKKQEKQNES